MTNQQNTTQSNLNGEQGKKPYALAVVLVLLVISLVFVILFATKSIGNKQEYQVTAGNRIVEHFQLIHKQLNYLNENLTITIEGYKSWNEDKAMVVKQQKQMLELVNDELDGLFSIASKIDKDAFNEKKLSEFLEWSNAGQLLLQTISEGTSQPSDQQLNELDELREQLVILQQTIEQFNFRMEGNRNAMIRLSNGFEWAEIAELMIDQLRIEK